MTNLHLAYGFSSKTDFKNKKIIFLHLHHIHRLDVVKDMNVEIIYTTRDPLPNLSSSIKNWSNFIQKKYANKRSLSPQNLFFHIDRICNGISNTLKFKKKTYILQLENLHLNHELVMREFCSKFRIKYEKCLEQSTYHGKKWWGDSISSKYLDGINVNFKNTMHMDDFFQKDIIFFEKCLDSVIKNYNYPYRSKSSKNFLLIFFPLKVEFMVWSKVIKSLNLLQILTIPYYWLKRVKSMNEARKNNFDLPYSFGLKTK